MLPATHSIWSAKMEDTASWMKFSLMFYSFWKKLLYFLLLFNVSYSKSPREVRWSRYVEYFRKKRVLIFSNTRVSKRYFLPCKRRWRRTSSFSEEKANRMLYLFCFIPKVSLLRRFDDSKMVLYSTFPSSNWGKKNFQTGI